MTGASSDMTGASPSLRYPVARGRGMCMTGASPICVNLRIDGLVTTHRAMSRTTGQAPREFKDESNGRPQAPTDPWTHTNTHGRPQGATLLYSDACYARRL